MQINDTCDAILDRMVTGAGRVPGVVAAVTDRQGDIWQGARGDRRLGDVGAIGLDTVFGLFSTTKAIAATAALQCAEEGVLDLDAPAQNYVPDIGKAQVLEGFDPSGAPMLRPPKSEITTRQLLLHTAGFAYDFFNASYRRLTREQGLPGVATCLRASLETPLLRDPGEGWEYGVNIDWAGLVVEAVRGKRLGEVCRERIFDPLEMSEIGFTPSASMKARMATVHVRAEDGSLSPMDRFPRPDPPEVDCGGHGLYATVPEYMKFIRMWLNDGAGPNGRVLKPETVDWAARNGLRADQRVVMLPGVTPWLSHDAEFFPGIRKGWAYSFMTNEEQAPTGRPAGAIGWAGLANLYFWIDRRNGIGGFWASQLLPFLDPASLRGYLDFETAVYRGLNSGTAA